MTPRAIIFDLDGTLIDSAAHFAFIINAMLADRGSARRLTRDEATPHLSLRGEHLIAGMLGGDGTDPTSDLAEFRLRYAALPTPDDSLFPDVRAGLKTLADAGHLLAICSNKPQYLCEKVVTELGLAASFSSVVGTTSDRAHKPDRAMLDAVLRELDVASSYAMFVGDSWVDAALCKAADVAFWFVTYGYPGVPERPEAERSFDRFRDVVKALSGAREQGADAAE